MLLKLDTNYLGWLFIRELLEVIGFGPNFVGIIEVIKKIATVVVLIRGKFLD